MLALRRAVTINGGKSLKFNMYIQQNMGNSFTVNVRQNPMSKAVM
jgi:hypothetical protein